jgi:hypothetical protein
MTSKIIIIREYPEKGSPLGEHHEGFICIANDKITLHELQRTFLSGDGETEVLGVHRGEWGYDKNREPGEGDYPGQRRDDEDILVERYDKEYDTQWHRDHWGAEKGMERQQDD